MDHFKYWSLQYTLNMNTVNGVDEYIENSPQEAREKLRQIRKIIKKVKGIPYLSFNTADRRVCDLYYIPLYLSV